MRNLSSHLNISRLLLVVISIVCCISIHSQSQLTNLPTLYITTDNGKPVVEKDVYLKGKLTLKSLDASEEFADVVTEIRGRGNSTWGMSKKPYRLKLDKKAHFLGLSANEKNWVLLANYADKTLMRNAVAFKLSEIIGMEFTPSAKFIDLVFNGEYLGNYMVSDQIEVADFRVPVETQETTDVSSPEVTGGYLLEIDGFADSEPVKFVTPEGLKITVKYPKDDEINQQQLAYITKFTNDFERKLFSLDFKDEQTGYRSMVDTTSLINWYIACELTGNPDSFWSTYIYKKRLDDKFYFGPLWDFDIAFNNDNRLGDAVSKLMREHAHHPRTWIQRLWQDEWFRQAVDRRWKELLADGLEDKLIGYVNETESLLQRTQQENFSRWDVLNKRVYLEQFIFNTYTEGVEYLRWYIKERIVFLTGSFHIPEQEKPTPPFVAENYYYRILNKRTNNAIDVSDNSLEHDAPLMMWAPNTEDDAQLWQIVPVGDYFRFINKRSGLAMAASGRENNLKQVRIDNDDASQEWRIIPLFTGGIYGIVNPSSGMSVNNSGGRFDNGNPVIIYDNNIYSEEKLNQHWYLNKVEDIPTTGVQTVNVLNCSYFIENRTICFESLPENTTIRLYTIQGRLVCEKKNTSGFVQLEVGQHGVFVVAILSDTGLQKIKVAL